MMLNISIHAPLAGCDAANPILNLGIPNFNPRTPCRVRLKKAGFISQSKGHFNPRTPCRVRPRRADQQNGRNVISIHAPLAGCDRTRRRCPTLSDHFNPRTPCRVRPAATSMRFAVPTFQSTHPLQGATTPDFWQGVCPADFNPRTPCRVRRGAEGGTVGVVYFNPRTPCRVRRYQHFFTRCQRKNFNPRTPCRVRPRPKTL